MLEETVRNHVEALLSSAKSRKTEQGLVVYNKVLSLLSAANCEEEVKDVLEKLNRALVGIEAHGHLSDEEFRHVLALRDLQ